MPPSATGKGDSAVQILKGSDIPSQYVGSNKHYLTSRRIDMLEQLTALKDVLASTAHRADGIIANLPANGRLEAAELVRMESSQILPTLFPEEQQALPKLWALLETAGGTPTAVNVPAVDLTITEQLTQPGGLTFPTSIAINTLPTDLQTVAKRVQLVFNGDSNATTIQVADIDKVLADPQAFTPAEVTQLNAIKLLFIERATSSEEAKAKMPEPGQQSKTTSFGQMSLELVTNLVIHERRQVYAGTQQQWNVSLSLDQTNAVTLHSQANNKVLAIALDTGDETIFDQPDIVYGDHPVGSVVIERYSMTGDRQETHQLALPPFQAGIVSTPATKVIDYRLFVGTTELKKNVYSTTQQGYYWVVDARYEKTMQVIPGIDQSLVDAVATPKSPLPTGRYEVPTANGNVAVDLYPEGVVVAHYNTVTMQLMPAPANQLGLGNSNVGGTSCWFFPASKQLQCGGINTILSAAQRTK
ncbi:MAG TPA: hypothetical protein VL326_21910 [Kofleriaceae bacterium]|nr:hypothetical protein [Kofleriaceae bacterium]